MPTPREIALDLALRMWGKEYIWGGDDPITGFDCSGMMVEILQSVGILPRNMDLTAQGLSDHFMLQATKTLFPGCLVFWKRGGNIGHVEMVYARVPIGGGYLTIGASGGTSATRTRAEAIAQNAYVKIRPLALDWVGAVDPFWGTD